MQKTQGAAGGQGDQSSTPASEALQLKEQLRVAQEEASSAKADLLAAQEQVRIRYLANHSLPFVATHLSKIKCFKN